ncbi:MAG: EamA family transporter [Actinobacteria bacterium]|nr:EamA family transporter [Actinomycetota bacterium]
MPLDALGLALGAAVLHAGWNVLLRGSRDIEAATAATLSLGLILFAPVAVATWHVHAAAWPYVAASSALETAYFFLLVGAYRLRELSVVYPVARGSAPVLVLLGSAVVLGRTVSTGEAAGVCLVAAGVLLVRGLAHGASGIAAGLAIGVTIAAYTLVDKDGVKHASPLPYLELVLVLPAVASVAYVLARRGVAPLRAQPRVRILVSSVASFAAYLLVLAALRLAPAPAVSAVRETGVVVAAVLAAVFLKERVTRVRLLGAIGVAAGVALLALS